MIIQASQVIWAWQILWSRNRKAHTLMILSSHINHPFLGLEEPEERPKPMPCLGTVKYQEDPVITEQPSTAPSNAPAVCVIGGGPSGLGCCRRLCDAGMRVTLIQESRGGMEWVWVRWGGAGHRKIMKDPRTAKNNAFI